MVAQKNKIRIFAGSTFIVFLLLASKGFATPIDLQLLINPIQICRSDTVCANNQQFMPQELINSIWNEAGISVKALPFQSFVDPSSFVLSVDEVTRETFFVENPMTVPPTWFDSTAPGKSAEQKIINLWFVDEINGGFSNIVGVTEAQETVFDVQQWLQTFGTQGSDVEFFNNIVISDSALQISESFFSYVISHEIGHALGLSHCDTRISGSNDQCPTNANLMSVQIAGEQLGSPQIDIARSSHFLSSVLTVSEPSMAYLLLPILALFWRRAVSK